MRAHYAAVKARLEADAALAGKVFDSARMAGTPPTLVRDQYVILFAHPGDRDDDRLTAPQAADSDADYEWRIRAVGITADAVLLLLTNVTAQLSGHRLVVAGRACTPIEVESDGEVEPDLTVYPPLFYGDVYASLHSSRI